MPIELASDEIPQLLRDHAKRYPGASALERQAEALIAAGFAVTQSVDFVEAVCEWGGGQRIFWRLKPQAEVLASGLKEAVRLINRRNVPHAVEHLDQIYGLGLSFASKHVRFLAPDRAVILDSIIRERLGYGSTRQEYDRFLSDCGIAHRKAQRRFPELRICEVEAAIFMKLRNRPQSPRCP